MTRKNTIEKRDDSVVGTTLPGESPLRDSSNLSLTSAGGGIIMSPAVFRVQSRWHYNRNHLPLLHQEEGHGRIIRKVFEEFEVPIEKEKTAIPLEIVLFQPEIPHNTGAVGRTCVAVGARLHLVRPLGFQLDQRHLRRAGMDYWNHLQLEISDDWEDLLSKRDEARCWFFSKHAETCYTDIDYRAGDMLVFGSESRGLPKEMIRRFPRQALRIPIVPEARSLNLSVSVGIAAYEARRQFLESNL
jgi:tRNA (cytidine/uridine-2'-O-)-methyltransferase